MTGTVLYDSTRSIDETRPGTPPRALRSELVSAECPHIIHGLVAIANGPDYCLCGQFWPCEHRAG